MVNMLAYHNEKTELDALVTNVRELIAYYSEESWDIEAVSAMNALVALFENQPMLDVACYDVSEQSALAFLRKIRGNGYDKMLLMLLADASLSPMEYIRPEILASELLLKPYSQQQLREKLRDMLEVYCAGTSNENSEDIFIIETKDGRVRVPFRQVYYYEAREKKVFLRTRKAEYPFYQTLDVLEDTLPEEFVRCHRSYIINWKLVEKVDYAAGELYLPEDVVVPFSRSYKARIKSLR